MYTHIKRLIDIFLSLFLAILLSPIFLIICALIFFSIGFPIFFKQKRIGKDGIAFFLIKFRTMKPPREGQSEFDVADRITQFGKFLRKSSLDELPEIFNILIGDMSFIGPRPLPEIYRNRYSENQWKRHMVRPGLSGLAQIKGRKTISWEKKLNFDVIYVKKMSLLLDIYITIKTILIIFDSKSADIAGEKEMPNFNAVRNNSK